MNFNIAHELFHLIVWGEKVVDKVSINKELHEHNEKITDAFVAALLVPSEVLDENIEELTTASLFTLASFVALAQKFEASLDALAWRMVALNMIKKKIRRYHFG